MNWRLRLWPLARPLVQTLFRWRRGMTLGVRGVVLDMEGRVLLVEHSYLPGWHLPGGGVERGEDAETALAREMAEEGGVRLTAPARLVSIHADHGQFRGDHVLLYRAVAWTPCASDSAGEIVRTGWFTPHALPPQTGQKTRDWIVEALGGTEE